MERLAKRSSKNQLKMNEQRAFLDLTTELLQRGTPIRFHATGVSMQPTIHHGETITIVPVEPREIKRGDIILYRAKTGVIAHRVIRILRDTTSALTPQPSSANTHWLLGYWVTRLLDYRGSVLGPQSLLLRFYTRGDAFETPDEPVRPDQVLGRVVSVERNGRWIDLGGKKAKILFLTRNLASRLKGQIGRIPIVAPAIRHVRRRGSLTSNL